MTEKEGPNSHSSVLFDLILYVPVNNFSVMLGWAISAKQWIKCHAQGHNTVTPAVKSLEL